ncbi:MAG: VOC family protein [Candidatus Gastranaerophilales bacterium]|nr:VOC family protein [Candidatus Gastranaerophilales bacterium]
MKFLHTMIRVTNVEKSLNFYQNILGLKLSRTKELPDATLYFLTDEAGCCEIELTYNKVMPEGGYEIGSYFGHLAFETENMDEFSEILKQHGLDYLWAPFKITAVGSTIAFIKDPDGFQIEIIEQK